MTPGLDVIGAPRAVDYVVGEFFAENSDAGSFYIVQNNWKYIAYGKSFPWFSNYTPQLLNLTDDTLEQSNRAIDRPEIVAQLDALLIFALNVSTYQDIDATVMRNDQLIFRSYLTKGQTTDKIKASFIATYKGFDDNDWNQVLLWNQTDPKVSSS